jgi:hypothetical protein
MVGELYKFRLVVFFSTERTARKPRIIHAEDCEDESSRRWMYGRCLRLTMYNKKTC